MKYWFIFCKTDILLEKREDGTYTIPCSEESPIEPKPWTHILNITPMEDGTEVKTFTIPEPVTDNPKYEMCGLRPSFYKLTPELYQKAGKCQELNYWDMNTQFLRRMRCTDADGNRHQQEMHRVRQAGLAFPRHSHHRAHQEGRSGSSRSCPQLQGQLRFSRSRFRRNR